MRYLCFSLLMTACKPALPGLYQFEAISVDDECNLEGITSDSFEANLAYEEESSENIVIINAGSFGRHRLEIDWSGDARGVSFGQASVPDILSCSADYTTKVKASLSRTKVDLTFDTAHAIPECAEREEEVCLSLITFEGTYGQSNSGG